MDEFSINKWQSSTFSIISCQSRFKSTDHVSSSYSATSLHETKTCSHPPSP